MVAWMRASCPSTRTTILRWAPPQVLLVLLMMAQDLATLIWILHWVRRTGGFWFPVLTAQISHRKLGWSIFPPCLQVTTVVDKVKHHVDES